MSTTREEITRWILEGLDKSARWMIVKCDTFEHADFPVYAMTIAEYKEKAQCGDMERIMEVYNLDKPLLPQITAARAYSPPNAQDEALDQVEAGDYVELLEHDFLRKIDDALHNFLGLLDTPAERMRNKDRPEIQSYLQVAIDEAKQVRRRLDDILRPQLPDTPPESQG